MCGKSFVSSIYRSLLGISSISVCVYFLPYIVSS